MTAPLVIDKSTGRKFGKSEGGNAVWLDENKTSIYKFYQFWLNVDDASAVDYIKLFTLLNKEQIEKIEAASAADPSARIVQRALAQEVTKIVHGEERLAQVEKVTAVLFGGASFLDLSDEELELLASEIPTVGLGSTLVEALVAGGSAKSNGDAKRLIQGGAVSLNGEKVSDDLPLNAKCLIKKGKNSFILVK